MNRKLRVCSVVGARPNFIKIAPLVRAFQSHPDRFQHTLVHTGQHYDKQMSDTFFETLSIPRPDVELGVGSGTHAEQVGHTMIAFERAIARLSPDWVIVVGDVNATCACAITAKKQGVSLAHVEAGLRSGDWRMPEEINRIIADRLSDLLFTTDALADANLKAEGVPDARIRRVGNIMIDTLEAHRQRAALLDPTQILTQNRFVETDAEAIRPIPVNAAEPYALLTLHRPSNVDDSAALHRLVDLLTQNLAPQMPLLWVLHPRTRHRLEEFGLWSKVATCPRLLPVHPLDYLPMLRLNMGAAIMLTDSGGLQEECCVLGTPCITLRENTERPVTLIERGGTSVLAGNDPDRIRAHFRTMLGTPRHAVRPPLWDGRTSERIVAAFMELPSEGMIA